MKPAKSDLKILKALEGEQVKVIIEDLGKPHFIRGKLASVGDDFILLQGDFSSQVIAIQTIVKITLNKRGEQ